MLVGAARAARWSPVSQQHPDRDLAPRQKRRFGTSDYARATCPQSASATIETSASRALNVIGAACRDASAFRRLVAVRSGDRGERSGAVVERRQALSENGPPV